MYTTLQIASALKIKIEPPISMLCSEHKRIRDIAVTLVPSKGVSVDAMCSILRQRAREDDEDTTSVFKVVSLRVLPDFTNRGELLLKDIVELCSEDTCSVVSLAETIGDIVRITKCDAPNVQSSAVAALAASFYDVKNREKLYVVFEFCSSITVLLTLVPEHRYELISTASSSHLMSTCAAISLVRSREKKKTKRRKTNAASKRRDRIILSLLQSLRHETRKDVQRLAADVLFSIKSPTIVSTIRAMIAPKLNGVSILRDGPWVRSVCRISMFEEYHTESFLCCTLSVSLVKLYTR